MKTKPKTSQIQYTVGSNVLFFIKLRAESVYTVVEIILDMKILCWNVNGVRSVGRKGFFDWLLRESPEVLCLQEVKCQTHQLEESYLAPLGYQSAWHCAQKLGYSGVAVYFKVNHPPKNIREGIGNPKIDFEGRVLILEYENFTLINAYFPNSQPDHARLGFKLEFCQVFLNYCQGLIKAGHNLIICGDFNIAHEEIDLANPKTNVETAGFLPEERAWMTKFLNKGYVDVFRHRHLGETGHYTWWSYRPGVRKRNIGWRIDYFVVNEAFLSKVKDCVIMPDVMGSDHCPVELILHG